MLDIEASIVEQYIADYVSRKYGKVVWCPNGFFPDHDGTVFHGSPDVRYEVKYDIKARKKKNLALEVSCGTVPSGLTTTTAFTWFQVVPATDKAKCLVFEFDVEALRRSIVGMRTTFGGNNHMSELVLLPVGKAWDIAIGTFILPTPFLGSIAANEEEDDTAGRKSHAIPSQVSRQNGGQESTATKSNSLLVADKRQRA